MRGRRADMWNVVVGLVIFLIATGGMALLYYKSTSAAEDEFETPICFTSAALTDTFRDVTVGFASTQWRCPISGPDKIEKKTLVKEPLWSTVPQVSIDKYGGQGAIVDRVRYEYNLNALLAKELKKCYIKTGFGNGTLFSPWYSFIGFSETDKNEQSWRDYLASYVPEYKGPPIACGLCSVVYLDHEALALFEGQTHVSSLRNYLVWHPHQLKAKESYWYYMDMDRNGAFIEPNFEYEVSGLDDPMVVFFYRWEMFQPASWGASVLNYFGAGLDSQGGTSFKVGHLSDLDDKCAFIANSFDDSVFS